LQARLDRELARKVEELSRYRSEFFGRLREVLGDLEDIEIVGDRFLFQSELLFPTASAQIGPAGKQQLQEVAETLKNIADQIPPGIDWVLQVNGHTDRRPISTERFPSNWELSAARAISIVRFLIDQGIPAERLAATGFAHYQPLDAAETEEAYSRNRRIELKLTSP
ncbi:MAG: OmpA family protein, partial [Candidatus Competibacteraceae bacterium]|nr:OmpA family protein [Candidatus Competibacteraceae bacterium]